MTSLALELEAQLTRFFGGHSLRLSVEEQLWDRLGRQFSNHLRGRLGGKLRRSSDSW